MAIRNYYDIFTDGKNNLTKNTPISSFNNQGTARAFLDIVATECDQIYRNIDSLKNTMDPTKCTNGELDSLGYILGISRNDAKTANDDSYTNFYFYIDNRINKSIIEIITSMYTSDEILVLEKMGYIIKAVGTNNIVQVIFPKGLYISGNGASYITTNDAVFDANNKAYTTILATSTGERMNVDANALINHDILQNNELKRLANIIKCVNTFPIQNGSYTMSDSEYRYAIATKSSAIDTNELKIRLAALSVPGVRDMVFERARYGNGTINILVDGITPLVSDSLIELIKQNVNKVASYGDTVYVDKPEYLGISFKITFEYNLIADDPFSVRENVVNNMIQYINDLPISGELIYNKLESIAFQDPGVKNITIETFKVGMYDSINKINTKEVLILGQRNVRAKFNQRFYIDRGLIKVC